MALVLTLIAEVPVSLLFGFRSRKDILSVVLINLITNPLANVLMILVSTSSWVLLIILLEVLVILAEWWLLIYSLEGSKKKLFWMSVTMNVASILFGILIFFLVVFLDLI
jgi:hypothetical protein